MDFLLLAFKRALMITDNILIKDGWYDGEQEGIHNTKLHNRTIDLYLGPFQMQDRETQAIRKATEKMPDQIKYYIIVS